MTSAIADRQDTPDNLRLLAAQRQLYSQAKFRHNLYAGAGLVLEFVAPWAILWNMDAKVVLDSIGAIAVLLSLYLRRVVGSLVKRAATVQEMFDVDVFELPWNGTLVGTRVEPELIHAADRAFKGDRSKLGGWYGDPGNLPRPLDVLGSQRSGLIWDRHLRRSYAQLFNVVTLGYFGLGIVVLTLAGRTLGDYLISLLIPSLPAIIEGFTIVKEHVEIAEEEERIGGAILELWETGLIDPTAATLEECRRLQDCMYIKRSRGPLIPDRWYWRYRDRDEATMQATLAELKAKAAHKRGSNPAP